MASHPQYYFRYNVNMIYGGLGSEVLTNYCFFINFDRIPEANVRFVFSFCGLNGAPSGSVNFRIGGVNIDTLDGTIIHTASVFGGFAFPQIIAFSVPNIWTGILPFKLSGSSNNGQAVALGLTTITVFGV